MKINEEFLKQRSEVFTSVLIILCGCRYWMQIQKIDFIVHYTLHTAHIHLKDASVKKDIRGSAE